MKARLLSALIPLSLLSLPALAAEPAKGGVPKGRPKLVLVVVLDQFRASDLERYGANLSGGLRRLQDKGAVMVGHYGQQNTYTGPGHAMILSGSYGYLNGIIQNKYYNQRTGRSEGMIFDPDATFLAGKTEPGDETSPRNFNGSTIGDELMLATGHASKTVTLALKERGAILLGGKLGTAYFFSEAVGEMTTSTYYKAQLPEWVAAFNAKKLPDAAFGKSWERLLPVGAYTTAGPDDLPWEGDILGMKRTFPHPLNGGEAKPGAKFYEAFTMSPPGLEYTFAFAKAAVEAEDLGGRGVTDVLGISVSPTDLIGHTYGVYSHESQDIVLRTDRALGELLAWLDKRLGADSVLTVLTADHGATPPPEQSAKMGLAGNRMKKAALKDAINAALTARFGAGEWVTALEDPSVYLNQKLITEKKLDRADVERTAGEAALGVNGFLGFFTRTQILEGRMPPTVAARAVARSYYPPRAGDVVLVQAPYSFWGKYGEKDYGGSHGSFYRYDTDVPLIFSGARFKPGVYGQTEMVDLAATLAWVLGVSPPAACEGEVITRILR